MNDDKKVNPETNVASNKSNYNNTQPLPVHNPLDKNDDKKITQQNVDDEQTFKEAQTERD